MKKVLIILVLSVLPIIGSAQSESVTDKARTETSAKESISSKTSNAVAIKAETKAALMDLNYKKSVELISINAYRKSLQIKVKTIKMC